MPREFFSEEGAAAKRRVEAQHAHLLFDFRISAEDCRSWDDAPAAIARLSASARTVSRKRGILERIIHVREHHVLPDQQAQFIAQAVKVFAFVNRRARHPNQIESAVAKQFQTLSRIIAGERASATTSGGVQTTPRQKMGIPLILNAIPASPAGSAGHRSNEILPEGLRT